MFRPTTGPFPQTSQRFAMMFTLYSIGTNPGLYHMDRRAFLLTAALPALRPLAPTRLRPPVESSDRDYWVGVLRRLADPVLENLARGTLKARMPVEPPPGPNRPTAPHPKPPARPPSRSS